MKRLMIISTTIAFCGGLATMMAASSCDPECVEDRRTSVYLHLTAGDEPWDPAEQAAEVSYSVYPEPYARGEDSDFEGTFGAVPKYRPARCLDSARGCTDFALGFDEPGTYEVAVDVCGKRFETTVEVPLSEDLCHIEPIDVELLVDNKACTEQKGPIEMAPEDRCDRMAHPSVYAVIGNTVGDVFMPINVDHVWYTVTDRAEWHAQDIEVPTEVPDELRWEGREHDPVYCEDDDDWKDKDDDDEDDDDDEGDDDDGGEDDDDGDDDKNDYPDDDMPTKRHLHATCVANPSGPGCMAWLAGFEQTGWFTVGVEYCGVTVVDQVFVGKEDANACHVDTRFVMLEVETRDCLGTPTKEPPAGDKQGADDIHADGADVDPEPAVDGPDDIKANTDNPDPDPNNLGSVEYGG